MKDKPQTLKGFRDFLPEDMRVRNYVLGVFRDVCSSFGFEPLQTPSLEYAATLLGKYGEEADRLVYTFTDRGDREVALPYDLTVPTAKVLALYQNKLSLPFKRYQIQRVWRAEKPQKGRYREVLQCDVDTFGIDSPLADAEIVAIIYTILKRLEIPKFTIQINSRQTIFDLLQSLGVKTKEQQLSLLRIIDKLGQKDKSDIDAELKEKGFKDLTTSQITAALAKTKPDTNLEQVIDLAVSLGVDQKNLEFTPSMVRGLDYYTGPIFETVVNDPKIGSITGGGRYNNLISQLGGPDTAATGTTIGLDRICDVMTELGLAKEELSPPTQILVTVFSPKYQTNSLELVTQLREQGIKTELYLNSKAKLDKQLKYASQKNIPFVAILGPEEVGKGEVTVKNMGTGEQTTGELEKILDLIPNDNHSNQ